MKVFLTVCLLFSFCSSPLFGQETFYLSQYNRNHSYANPAYAGAQNQMQFTAYGVRHFLDIEDGPKDIWGNFNTALGSSLGVGVQFAQQRTLANAYTEAGLDLAYHLRFGNPELNHPTLSMGLHADVGKNQFLLQGVDQSLDGYTDAWLPNFGFGLMLHNPQAYLGISLPRLFTYKSLNGERQATLDLKQSAFYLTAGTKLRLREGLHWRNSAQIRYAQGEPLAFDLTSCLLLKESFELGAFYRHKTTVGVLAALPLFQNLTVGYSFGALLLLEDAGLNTSTHEFVLDYRFALKDFRSTNGVSGPKPRYRR